MYDFGYIAATFFSKDILNADKMVKKLCKLDDFYGEKGNVTHKLHLTLFYGIIEADLDKVKFEEFVKKIELKELKIEGVVLIPAHKDFQVLSLKVADEKGLIARVHEDFKQFPFDPSVQHANFISHITLAYVKPSFRLNQVQKTDVPSKLNIKEIKYFGIQA